MSVQALPFNLPVGTTIEVVNGGFFIRTSGNNFTNKLNEKRYKGITGRFEHKNRFKRVTDTTSESSVKDNSSTEDENVYVSVNNIPKKFFGAILGKDGYNSNELFKTDQCHLIVKDDELFIQHSKQVTPDVNRIAKDIVKKVNSFKMTKSTDILKRIQGSKIIGVNSENKNKIEEAYKVKICINDVYKDEFMKEGRKATFKKNEKGDYTITIDNVAFTWFLKVTEDDIISGEFPKADKATAVFDNKAHPDRELGTIKVTWGNNQTTYFKNIIWNFKKDGNGKSYYQRCDVRIKDQENKDNAKNIKSAYNEILKIINGDSE